MRPLLGEDEFAAREIDGRPCEQERDLEREDVFAIEVLMQAVVIVGAVPEQERGRLRLARLMATVEEGLVVHRVADLDLHRLIPAVGDFRQRRIERGPQVGDERRQGIGEVSIFPATESVACHDDMAAKDPEGVVAVRGLDALLGRDQTPGQRLADQLVRDTEKGAMSGASEVSSSRSSGTPSPESASSGPHPSRLWPGRRSCTGT